MLSKTIALAGLLLAGAIGGALAQETQAGQTADERPTIVLGLQESGTVQWEIAALEALGLDDQYGVTLQVRPLADSNAGRIALLTGTVDVILSDFVWVSSQRAEGNMVTMVPHSLAVGGLMAPAESEISDLADLAGKTIGVAGGPADKSWAILKARYAQLTGDDLIGAVSARFGAPPLINQLLASGGIDAGLNFWHWNARAKAAGMTELASVAGMLAELGVTETPPLLGWTFSDATSAEKTEALTRFLDASFATKAALASDDNVWDGLRELMGAAEDDALFATLRDDYRAGIVTHYGPATVAAAEQTFALLAQYGGPDVVGDSTSLSPGTFWSGYAQ